MMAKTVKKKVKKPPETGKTNGLAIAALVLGIASIVLGWMPVIGQLVAIFGLALGITALAHIKGSEEQGKGMAIAGIITSSLGLLVWLMILIATLTFLNSFRIM